MHNDLESLHALGILVRDIHLYNYLGGKLVDLSRAWTMYHICLDRSTALATQRARIEEPSKFEEMIDIWAFREGVEISKPGALVKWHSKQDADLGNDPRNLPILRAECTVSIVQNTIEAVGSLTSALLSHRPVLACRSNFGDHIEDDRSCDLQYFRKMEAEKMEKREKKRASAQA
ncbi:hypothetical protein J7T55_008784 [Diaporthe amygdali]|uniref:uncharacterized protein n=1 Tax=Phomopsis amygdali TaxID=1214568 RepID=UPI0022FE6E32|nr:uncharacterized protein J7T55_008784 [Diaporthe amygdali]KAJ0121618.1 hypothetical protein J7T55_008784 [Diaporthe amygdali]